MKWERELEKKLEKANDVPGFKIALNALQLGSIAGVYSKMGGTFDVYIQLADIYVDPTNSIGVFTFYKTCSGCTSDDTTGIIVGLYNGEKIQLSEYLYEEDENDCFAEICSAEVSEFTITIELFKEKDLRYIKDYINGGPEIGWDVKMKTIVFDLCMVREPEDTFEEEFIDVDEYFERSES